MFNNHQTQPDPCPTTTNQQETQSKSSNSLLHLRRRPNAVTSPSFNHPDNRQIIQLQGHSDNTSYTSLTENLTISSSPQKKQNQEFPIEDIDHSNQSSHSSTITKASSNSNILSSSEKEAPVECRDFRNDIPNHSDQSNTKTNQPVDNNEQAEEEPLCRICLGGRDDDDPTLGRFIQPCLCRGTMAFIHVGCLQRWRITSPSLKSFYRCDQCGYRYKLRRAKIAGLAQNKAILGGVTFMIFFILVIVSGFIAGWLLENYSQITAVDTNWEDSLSPFAYDSTGKIVGEVVGEAVRVLNSKLHVDRTTYRDTTPISRSKLTSQARSEKQGSKLQAIQTNENEGNSYRYVRTKTEKSNQDQPLAVYSTRSNQRKSSETHKYSSSMTNQKGEQSTDDEEETKQNSKTDHIFQTILSDILSNLEALIKHTIKGLAFIGVMSFFQLAMSVTLFSPWNFGIRNSVLRMMRTGTGGNRPGGGRPGDPNGIGSLLILLFVLLGVLKAIQSVWRFVRKSSQWALRKIEDGVLDVRSS